MQADAMVTLPCLCSLWLILQLAAKLFRNVCNTNLVRCFAVTDSLLWSHSKTEGDIDRRWESAKYRDLCTEKEGWQSIERKWS